MAHRAISFGPMPVALACLDVSNVTDPELASLGFRGDPPAALGDDENLITVVNMPACVASLAEVHNAAIEICRLPGLDDGLAGAMHRSGIPIGRFRRTWRGDFGDILQRDNLHDTLSLMTNLPTMHRR